MEKRTNNSSGEDARDEAEGEPIAGSGAQPQGPTQKEGYMIPKQRPTTHTSPPSHADGPRASRERSEVAPPRQHGEMLPPRSLNASMAGHMGTL